MIWIWKYTGMSRGGKTARQREMVWPSEGWKGVWHEGLLPWNWEHAVFPWSVSHGGHCQLQVFYIPLLYRAVFQVLGYSWADFGTCTGSWGRVGWVGIWGVVLLTQWGLERTSGIPGKGKRREWILTEEEVLVLVVVRQVLQLLLAILQDTKKQLRLGHSQVKADSLQ